MIPQPIWHPFPRVPLGSLQWRRNIGFKSLEKNSLEHRLACLQSCLLSARSNEVQVDLHTLNRVGRHRPLPRVLGRSPRRFLPLAQPDPWKRQRQSCRIVIPPVGGLETGYAAKCRGLSDRATCVCARRKGYKPAATADADPPDEPPGTRDVSHGFLQAPK